MFGQSGGISSAHLGLSLFEAGGDVSLYSIDVKQRAVARVVECSRSSHYLPVRRSSRIRSLASARNLEAATAWAALARSFSDNSFALYAQDTWRPTPNVSLSYGLRYEVNQAPVEAHNLLVNDYPGACQDPNGSNLVCLIRSGTNQIFNSDGSSLGTSTFTAPRAGFNTDFNNFGPHLGMAWSPGGTGQTVWRAGFALTYDQQSLEPSVNMLLNPPFVQQTASISLLPVQNNPTTLATTFPAGFLTQGEYCTSSSSCGSAPKENTSYWFPQPYSITARDPKTRTPYVYQYNFGIQEQLGRNAVLGIAYVGSLGRKLPSNLLLGECTGNDFNTEPGKCLPPLGGLGLTIRRQGSELSNSIIYQTNNANSNFNSLQVRLDTRSYHGLTIQAFYQWAHSIDNASSAVAPVFLLSPTAAALMAENVFINADQLAGLNNINPTLSLRPGLPVITTGDVLPNSTDNSGNLANQRANSDFDIRQRFVIAYTYAVPPWKQVGLVGKGWQLSGITVVQSGQPYSVYTNFFGAQLRPSPNGPTTTNNSNPNGAIDNGLPAGCNVGPYVCYGTSAASSFNVQSIPEFTPGSLARNTFYGPGLTNFDFSVVKNTYFGESRNLQFRAEFFNLFNTTNLRQPFSQTGQVFGSSFISNPFFGLILQARAARQIQFGLKFGF